MSSGIKAPDYGLDGNPLSMIAALAVLTAADFVLFLLPHNPWRFFAFVLLVITAVSIALVSWSLFYSMLGKTKHRDALLSMIDWRGDETVLDVGTGRGLLMIGAAKKLNKGRAIGIDVWRQQDMWKNTSERTLANAGLEGVGDRIEIRNEDIRNTSFPPEYFDVILSNLCLHNIPHKEGRKAACKEIVRILKPSGVIVISDGFHLRRYLEWFREEGLSARIVKAKFPPRTVWLPAVVAKKESGQPAGKDERNS